MPSHLDRRSLLRIAGFSTAAAALGQQGPAAATPRFKISLAEWSLHRTIFGKKLDNLDFPRAARMDYGIEAVEYVNQFFKDKARDMDYLRELDRRCKDHGVRSLLIMCDGEGDLGHPDPARRNQAVENHKKWVDAARFLGCHSIRVNAGGGGTPEEAEGYCADGLGKLADYAAGVRLNVIVENHGGHSSNADWFLGVLKRAARANLGTLPDFGNFGSYDRYEGTRKWMPYAKGVSAKSHEFDAAGNEVRTDYARMLKIVLDAGYDGYIGIEYEGDRHSDPEGIRLTKALLERFQ